MHGDVLATTLITAPDASPERWIVVLHGILGSRANWRSIARAHTRQHPDRGVVLMDLRRHGESLAVTGDDTLEQCARDVAATVAHLELSCDAVVGHSFGGKVAATWALRADSGIERVLVVDAPLSAGHVGSSPSVAEVIARLRGLPTTFESRTAFVTRLVHDGFSQSLAAWLSMNLRRTEGGEVVWPLDLDAIQRLLDDYLRHDLTGIYEAPPPGLELLVVAGGASAAWPEEARASLEAAGQRHGQARLAVLEDAGHWVHADDPEGLLALMAAFLP
ncbi:MAG: alpha/beta fold hydrolase [Nannocystaceae bacterium]